MVGAANYLAKTQGIGSLPESYATNPLEGNPVLDGISSQDLELLLEVVRAEYQALSDAR